MERPILKLVSHSAIYGFGNMVQRFSTLLLLPIFTAYLSPEEYGVYALLILLGAVAQPVFSMGLNAAMGPQYFEVGTVAKRMLVTWTGLIIATVSATFLVLLAWTIPEILLKCVLLPAEHSKLASLLLTSTGVSIILGPLSQCIQFEQKAKRFVLISIISSGLTFILSVLGVAIWGHGILALIYAQLIGNLAYLILALWGAGLLGRPSFSKAISLELIRVGIPLIPSFALIFLIANVGKYVLQYTHGESALGVYAVAFQLGTGVNIIVGAMTTAWYPFFMSYIDRKSEAADLFGKLTTFYCAGLGLICLGIFATADVLIYYISDEAFHEAGSVLGLISIAYVFQGLYNLFLPPLYYHNRVFMVTAIQMFAAIASIVLALVLCPSFGLHGAGLSFLGGFVSMALFLWIYNKYSARIRFKIKYNLRPLYRFGILSLGIIVISFYPVSPQSIAFFVKPIALIAGSFLSIWISLGEKEREQIWSFFKLQFRRLHQI